MRIVETKTAIRSTGGEGGIRTPGGLSTTPDFETSLPYIVINHLADGWSLSAPVGIVNVVVLANTGAGRVSPGPCANLAIFKYIFDGILH